MIVKSRSAATLVVLWFASNCALPAQNQKLTTNSKSPVTPAASQPHQVTPAHPASNPERPAGGGSAGKGPSRIIHEYSEENQTLPVTHATLSASESAVALKNFNAERSRLRGVNRVPLPPGMVSAGESGTRILSTADHQIYELRMDGSLAGFWHGNTVVMYRSDGTPWLLHTRDVTIKRGAHGEEHFEVELPGEGRVVGWGLHDGYVERPLPRGDGHYVQRSYVVGGLRFSAVFRTFNYNGITLATYVPDKNYSPAIYDWAARNWPQHVHYAWPWLGDSWAAPYRRHFEREYPDLTAWLADYLFAAILQKDFSGSSGSAFSDASGAFYIAENEPTTDGIPDQFQNSPPSDPASPGLMSSLNEQAQDFATKGNDLAPKSGPGNNLLVNAATPVTQPADSAPLPAPPLALLPVDIYWVDSPLSVLTENGVKCTLTAGAQLNPDSRQLGKTTVAVTVQTRNLGDCPLGARVQLGVDRLQEMANSSAITKYAALRTLCGSLARLGRRTDPWCAGPSVPDGQPSPALTSDASAQIVQGKERAKAAEQAATQDAESWSIQSSGNHIQEKPAEQ